MKKPCQKAERGKVLAQAAPVAFHGDSVEFSRMTLLTETFTSLQIQS